MTTKTTITMQREALAKLTTDWDTDIGKSGERAVVTSVGTGPLAHMTLVFPNRGREHEHEREVRTGANYRYLRSV